MNTQDVINRSGSAIASAMIGAICGGMLAAFGNVISSSTAVVAGTVVVTAVLGAWIGQFWGAVHGSMLGGLLTAFGALIGGSALGVTCAIGVCALLGGSLQWHSSKRWNDRLPRQQPAPASVEADTSQQQACFALAEHVRTWHACVPLHARLLRRQRFGT